jgi:outer membrane receptor for ferrienterochelin and colicin
MGFMISRQASRALTLSCALACVGAGEAFAQTPEGAIDSDSAQASAPANGVISYPPSFFAEYRPITAAEMVSRIPGFNSDRGDDVRGFGGAAGNVLIDGERPSSKTVTVDDALRRILPSQVERIDLIRGGAPGIDMQGQAVVANVIRKKGAETSLSLEFMGKLYNDHQPGAAPRIDVSTRIGELRLSGAMGARIEKQQGDSGNGNFIRRNGRGDLIARGPFHAEVEMRTYTANAAAEYGDFRLNVGASREEFPRTEYADLTNNLGVRSTEKVVNDLTNDKAEIGGDYQRQLPFGLTGRLIAIHTYKASDLVSAQTRPGVSSRSTKKTDGGESILRGTVRGLFQGMTVESGGEIAINTLDVASTLRTGGVAVVLPSANVRVEESRMEGFITASHKPTPRLSIESGVRVETSTITQSGDVSKEKTLSFAKPRLALSYEISPTTQLRARLERTVGQLNFEDFAASGDLTAGVLNVGNSNLEPERAWVSEIAWEQRFWEKGALVVTATHSAVEQVVDVIPIFNGAAVFDAPGNLGDGTKDELNISLALPFDKVGLKGLSLRANHTWRRSRVTDPTTGAERPFSSLNPWEGSYSLTQDLPRLKSTFVLNAQNFGNKVRQYRSNETRFDYTTPNYLNVQWNWRPAPSFTFTIQVFENIFLRERRRERVIYQGPRSNNIIATTEERSAEMEPFIMFRLRKTL